MITYFKNIENIILFFLSIFLIGFFNEHLNSFKSIGIISALILFLYSLIKNKRKYSHTIKEIYFVNKHLLIIFIIFLFIIFISSFFAYENSAKSLYSFYKEIKYPIIFGIILSALSMPKEKVVKYIVLSIVLGTIALNFHFLFKNFDYNAILQGTYRADRFFSTFFEIVFPFSLFLFLTTTNKSFKLIIFVFSILLGIVLLLFTGARGSWLMIFVETSIILIYILFKNKKLFFIHKKYIITTVILSIIGLIGLYNHSNIIQTKIKQSSNSSGRDIILKDRFPIFINSNQTIIGLGYGTYNYNQFMNDNNAPKRVGTYDSKEKIFKYWHDEPYLLSIFYHYGIFGLLSITIFLIYFIYKNLILFIKNRYDKNILFQISIFSSILGIFFVRGLFENMHLKYVVILYCLYLLSNTHLKGLHK